MAVYSQMINKFCRFHLLKGLFITHPCLWKCLQTFLAIKFHFELLIFFIVFFLILNNTILILKKNLVLKDYRPVLMVFLLSKNGILHSVLLSVFYAFNVLLFLSSALIYLHIVNKKKTPKASVYPPFSLMNLIAIISLQIVRIPV